MNDEKEMTREELIRRWDVHTERQVAVSKAVVAAVTVLNSGSWIALLSQIDSLVGVSGGETVVPKLLMCWGFGALLGTFTWFFVYLNVVGLGEWDISSGKSKLGRAVTPSMVLGLMCCLASLVLFAWGVVLLGGVFS